MSNEMYNVLAKILGKNIVIELVEKDDNCTGFVVSEKNGKKLLDSTVSNTIVILTPSNKQCHMVSENRWKNILEKDRQPKVFCNDILIYIYDQVWKYGSEKDKEFFVTYGEATGIDLRKQ